jgi:hypothetical protein
VSPAVIGRQQERSRGKIKKKPDDDDDSDVSSSLSTVLPLKKSAIERATAL